MATFRPLRLDFAGPKYGSDGSRGALLTTLAARLAAAGLSGVESEAKASLFERALESLGPTASDARLWWVPGRLEFLGKHTDYAGGPSLVCAIERGFAVAAINRPDQRFSVCDARTGERVEAQVSPDLEVKRDHWSNYPLTVCRRVARNFAGGLRGVDLAFASDLPPAAGLSSSSALIVATFLALTDANDLPNRPNYREAIHSTEDLAGYLGAVENGSSFHGLTGDRGVGTQGGSQDHTAILGARPGALSQYVYVPVRFERDIPLPNDLVFVIAASGVAAEKTGRALELYNRASACAREALEAWRVATGQEPQTLAEALADVADYERIRRILHDRRELADRVDQFYVESMLVRDAGDALVQGKLHWLGAIVDASQSIAERFLGNQIPETIGLAQSARKLGALAASAFGAGFGGSVYALVPSGAVEEFIARWKERYRQTFPKSAERATFFVSHAGPPAFKL